MAQRRLPRALLVDKGDRVVVVAVEDAVAPEAAVLEAAERGDLAAHPCPPWAC